MIQKIVKQSLIAKILLVLIPLVILSEVLVFTYQGWRFYDQGVSNQVKNLEELLQVQSAVFTQPLWEFDDQEIDALMTKIMRLSSVDSIVIYDNAGDVMKSMGDTEIVPNFPEFRASHDIIRKADNESSRLGRLQLTVNDKDIVAALFDYLWFNGLILLTLIIVLTVSVLFTIQKFISSPLKLLQHSIHEAKSGDQRTEVSWKSSDELGIVVDSYNEMLRAQEAAEDSLLRYQENLEAQVEERTADLEKSKAQLQNILDTGPVGIGISVNGIMKLVNPWLAEMTGIRIGDSAVRAYVNAEDRQRLIESLKEDGIAQNLEVQVYGKNGDIRDFLLTVYNIDFQGETGTLSWSVDITEMKIIQNDLAQAKEIAEEANRTKSDFLANMSHEIRTPMNAILGLTRLALQTDLDKKQYDYLSKTFSSANSLLGIINDVLDFSKIEAGKLEIEEVNFNLDDVFDNISNLVALKAQEKGLEFLLKTDPETPNAVIGDPLRLGQILLNLTNNAVKFTEKGEIVIVSELIEEQGNQIKLQFTVKDTGIGLTPEQAGKLFQAFSQADASTTRKFGGTGLGLTISKRLAELMGGSIWVESDIGEGSSFIFTIACRMQNEPYRTPNVVPPELEGLHVLVVDDNKTAREILTDLLQSFAFKVSAIDSGTGIQSELEKAADDPVALVLMDHEMPDLDGIETSIRIRKLPLLVPQPKIIMLNATNKEELIKNSQEIEFNGMLTKPVNAAELFNAIMVAYGKEPISNRKKKAAYELDVDSLKPIQGAKILLVEDNEINQQVAQELLVNSGFFVDIAEDGQKAVEAVERNDYDLVLMDIQMPIMDGLQATRKIRENLKFKDLPILAMSASAMTQDREESHAAGMNDHVAKPIIPSQLFSALQEWIKSGERALPETFKTVEDFPQEDTAELINMAGIDVKTGLERVSGNQKLFRSILKKFAANQIGTIEEIRKALEDKDIKLASRLAHTLKGVSGNIGATELQSAAEKLEAGIQKEGPDVAPNLIESAQVLLDQAVQSIQGIEEKVEKTAQGSKLPSDISVIKELTQKLKILLEDDDTAAVEIIEELKLHLSGSDLEKNLPPIENSISQYEFEEALEQLSFITEKLGPPASSKAVSENLTETKTA
ncbi:MAG: response regulator [SAR324 cluster bacterium]|nr:response regulator [SAR324 cluster bacterium]